MLALLQTLHFVSDSLFYQNHTYLMVLTSWALCFMPSDVIEEEWPWATPKREKKLQKTPTPAGSYGLSLFLKGVFLITFFSGSLRKINPDWLSFHPLLEWIPMQLSVKFPLLLPLSDWIAVAMSVAGIVVDALIPMLLVSATTAWAGLGLLVAFMVTNGLLWEIDIFPMITLAYGSLFVPWKSGDSRGWSARSRADSVAWVALACFLVVSSALPSVLWLSSAQHYAGEQPEGYSLPSSVDTMWAECGMEFTWRMMLRFKDCEVFFFLVSPAAGRAYFVNVERLVNQAEYLSLAGTPYQLLHFSHILASGQFASVYPGVHWDDIQVYALTTCSLNGRPNQPLLDPTLDLSAVPWTYCPRHITLAPEHCDRPEALSASLPSGFSEYDLSEARQRRGEWKQDLFANSKSQFTQFAYDTFGITVPLTLLF